MYKQRIHTNERTNTRCERICLFTARDIVTVLLESSQLMICACTNPKLLDKGEKGIGRHSRSHSTVVFAFDTIITVCVWHQLIHA